MFRRIQVDIVKMAFEIGFVTNAMFPKMALPDFPTFFLLQGCAGNGGLGQVTAKPIFYQAPTQGKIAVAFGQLPNAVHMLRQYDPGDDGKGMFLSDVTHALAQQVYFPNEQVIVLALPQINGKEPCAAIAVKAFVVGHMF